jgi:hypothetical protein
MRAFEEKSRSTDWRPFGLRSHGRPLDGPTRTKMESHFARDFSGVAVHTDSAAAEAAAKFESLAFARGNHIYFGASNFAPTTPAGWSLLTHELGHVVEQSDAGTPIVQRKAIPGKTVKVGGSKYTVQAGDTLSKIADAVYGKASLWPKIKAANPTKMHGPSKDIIITGEVLDIPVIDADAMETFKAFEGRPEQLRDVSRSMSDADYKTFLGGLPQKEQEANAGLLQSVEITRSSGKTPDELAADQKAFLEAEAKKKSVTSGAYVNSVIATTGYGGGTASKWLALTPDEQKKWGDRFTKVIADIEKGAPADIKDIITTAKKNGGGFVWDPEATEKNGAFAFTRNDWKLYCGMLFVEAAEKDNKNVYANIAHEMGGHNFYGPKKAGLEIQKGALDKLPAAEKTKALAGGNSLNSAYGYMETEIFAELYEYQYDSPSNPTDHPFAEDPKGNKNKGTPDVPKQLGKIKAAFAPNVAEAIVRGLARRVEIDPRITAKAKSLFKDAVKSVFGFTP